MNLIFRPIGESEFEILKTWFTDPETAQRLSAPTAEWFNYVRNTPGVYAWMIFDGDTPVGHAQVDVEANSRASILIGVKAEFRGQGYGRNILRDLVNRPELSAIHFIDGYIEVDNIASQRSALAAGFQQVGDAPDEDGMLKFTYSR